MPWRPAARAKMRSSLEANGGILLKKEEEQRPRPAGAGTAQEIFLAPSRPWLGELTVFRTLTLNLSCFPAVQNKYRSVEPEHPASLRTSSRYITKPWCERQFFRDSENRMLQEPLFSIFEIFDSSATVDQPVSAMVDLPFITLVDLL